MSRSSDQPAVRFHAGKVPRLRPAVQTIGVRRGRRAFPRHGAGVSSGHEPGLRRRGRRLRTGRGSGAAEIAPAPGRPQLHDPRRSRPAGGRAAGAAARAAPRPRREGRRRAVTRPGAPGPRGVRPEDRLPLADADPAGGRRSRRPAASDRVRFGATVTVRQSPERRAAGAHRRRRRGGAGVGERELDLARSRRSLMGARVGDTVACELPSGPTRMKVLSIDYR